VGASAPTLPLILFRLKTKPPFSIERWEFLDVYEHTQTHREHYKQDCCRVSYGGREVVTVTCWLSAYPESADLPV